MGTKRLITAGVIVATILASIGVLLFQVGADEQLMATVLPRVEKKFGLKITYHTSDASLTSLTLRGVQISKADTGDLLAVVQSVAVGFRVGPLFFGEIDVTGVRIRGLDVRIGRKAGGASLRDWSELLAARMQASKEISSRSPDGHFDIDVIIEKSGFLYNDGRVSLLAQGISGTISEATQLSLKLDDYTVQSKEFVLLRGKALTANFSRDTNQLTVEAENPKINLPSEREALFTLVLDITKSIVNARNLIQRKSETIQGKKQFSPSLLPQKPEIQFVAERGVANFTDKYSPEHKLQITDIKAELVANNQQSFSARLSGRAPGSQDRFNISLHRGADSKNEIGIEIPDTKIASFGQILPLKDHIKWEDVHLSGRLDLRLNNPPTLDTEITGDLQFSNLTVSHERMANSPLRNLSFQIDFDSTYNHLQKTIELNKLQVTRGLATALLQGTIHLSHLEFDLQFIIPPTACRKILGAIPDPFKARMRNVTLGGIFSLGLNLSIDENHLDDITFDARFVNNCTFEDYGHLPKPSFFHGPFAYVAYTGLKENLHLITGPGTDRWTPLYLISPYVIEAVITTEDNRFWSHQGVTLPEVKRAIMANIQKRTLKHGASTITMQLAKNLFLSRERTIARKFQELFYVWYLESHFNKREILELYLNIVEFGPSIYGIRDAAGYYFGREPSELTLRESLFLIKLLPAPVPRHNIYIRGYLNERNISMLHRALAKMRSRKRITEFEYREALRQKLAFHKPGDPLPPSRPPIRRMMRIPPETADEELVPDDL